MRTNTLSHLIFSFVINTLSAGVLGSTGFTAIHELGTLLTFIVDFYFILLADQLLTSAVSVHPMETNTPVHLVRGIIILAFRTHCRSRAS